MHSHAHTPKYALTHTCTHKYSLALENMYVTMTLLLLDDFYNLRVIAGLKRVQIGSLFITSKNIWVFLSPVGVIEITDFHFTFYGYTSFVSSIFIYLLLKKSIFHDAPQLFDYINDLIGLSGLSVIYYPYIISYLSQSFYIFKSP